MKPWVHAKIQLHRYYEYVVILNCFQESEDAIRVEAEVKQSEEEEWRLIRGILHDHEWKESFS